MDAFAALADPVRRSLLEQLAAQGSARVVDLTAGRGISRPAVSRHLRLLGEAGLVRATEAGRERHYVLTPDPLEQVATFIDGLRSATSQPSTPPVTETALDALGLEVRRAGRDRRAEARTRHTSRSDTTDAAGAHTSDASADTDTTHPPMDTEESA